MPREVVCPDCDFVVSLSDTLAGWEVTCPRCQKRYLVAEVSAADAARGALPPRPPHPGFWWAVLWCLGILAVTTVVPGVVSVVMLLGGSANVQKSARIDPQGLLNSPAYAHAML